MNIASAYRDLGSVLAPDTIWIDMGFNPFREQRNTVFDVFVVVVALAVTAAVIIWAIVG